MNSSLALRPHVQLGFLLVIAVLLGGGGSSYGLNNLAVQLVALALIAWNNDAVADFARRGPRLLTWLIAATFALPLLQVVPLPPAVWAALPGRELVAQTFDLLGAEGRWFPISVHSNRTILALASLLPVLAVIVLARQLTRDELIGMARLLVMLGLAGLVLGAIQLGSDGALGRFYGIRDRSILLATFANRNTTALFLVICLIWHLFLRPPKSDALSRAIHYLLAGLLALGVLLTQSRSGTLLLILALAGFGASLLVRPSTGGEGGSGPRAGLVAGAIALIVGGLALVLIGGTRLDATFDRFGESEIVRPQLWEDSLYSAGRFWPVGSGTGTFDEVFQLDESLEYLSDARTVRAHNDYLELAVESGALGLALALAWAIWFALAMWRGWRAGFHPLFAPASLSLLAILAQSVTDFPLRNQTILCVAALMVLFVSRGSRAAGARMNDY